VCSRKSRHELMRKLKGRDVQMTHGLADSVQQLDKESPEFKQAVIKFLDDLVSHHVFDDGKLVVRTRGHEGGNAGAWIGQGTRFCSLRRDNGRDGRLRTPCVTTGLPNFAARPWSSTGIRPLQSPNA